MLDSSGFLEIDESIHVFCLHDIVKNSFSSSGWIFFYVHQSGILQMHNVIGALKFMFKRVGIAVIAISNVI